MTRKSGKGWGGAGEDAIGEKSMTRGLSHCRTSYGNLFQKIDFKGGADTYSWRKRPSGEVFR